MKLDASFAGAKLKAEGKVLNIMQADGLDLRLNLVLKQLKEFNTMLDAELPAIGPLNLSARLTNSNKKYFLRGIKGKIGRTDISGRLEISAKQDLKDTLKIAAWLNSKALYLDDFIKTEKTLKSRPDEDGFLPAVKLPTALMDSLDMDLNFTAGKLLTKDILYRDMQTQISIDQNKLVISPFKLRLNNGTIQLSLDSRLSNGQANTSFKLEATDIDYGDLSKTLNITNNVSGLADLKIDISGKGFDSAEILKSASGKGRITSGPGKIDETRIDLWAEDIFKIALTNAFKPVNQSELNCMVADFEMNNGELSSDSLLLDTHRMTVAGSGFINLADENINLLLTPAPKSPKLISLAQPVRLTGQITKPNVEVAKADKAWMLGGLLAGLANPATLVLFYGDLGTMGANPCEEALKKRELEEDQARKQGKKAPAGLPGGIFKRLLRPFH